MALIAALVLPATVAAAQETAVKGPLRMVGGTDSFIGMISPAQQDGAGSPEVWVWYFHRELKLTYAADFDTTADHYRIDCRLREVTPLRQELFRENEFLGNITPEEPFVPAPRTAPGLVVAAVCDPGFDPEATFPDAAAGRAAVTRHFATR